MIFWRELTSGLILCVLCCAAVIYSFSPPARRTVDAACGWDAVPEEASTAAPGRLPKAAIGTSADAATGLHAPLAEAGEPRVLGEDSSAMPVSESDRVRWVRLPPEISERPLPDLAEPAPVPAEVLPPFGHRAGPEFDYGEPLLVVAAGGDAGAPLPPERGTEAVDPHASAEPEFVAARPSVGIPGPADLLPREFPGEPGEPVAETLPETPDRELSVPALPALDLPVPGGDERAAKRLVWHPPTSLLDRIDDLARQPETRGWANSVAAHIALLGPSMEAASAEAGQLLDALEATVEAAPAIADRMTDLALAAHLQRTAHALRRRIDVWRFAHLPPQTTDGPLADGADDWDALALSVARVEAHMGDTTVGQAWREYLLLDALRQWTDARQAEEDYAGRKLAQAALERLTQIPMDAQQRHFIDSRPVHELKARLHRMAAAPVDFGRLLAHLERYERTRTAGDARLIARDYGRLASADAEAERALATRLAMHYRNANLRFAVSESLLNRLMPEHDPEYAPVNDIVLGVAAQGQRATSTDMQVRLIPDPHRARLALDVRGQIYSRTTSSSGPATFLTNSLGSYIARKPIQLDLDGIRVAPAEVRVSNDMRLLGVRTEFDGLPLLGSLVNSVARSQHEQHQPAANAEIRARIYHEAKSRIDREADARLADVSRRLRTKLLEPMRRLRLDPVLIDAETNEDRLNMRIRLAGESQLGSHTPRPRAPADSLASLQLHESAINNVLDRLDLDGRTFTLAELSQHVSRMLNMDDWLNVGPDHEDVSITFAAANAVTVHCQEGRVGVTLLIERLRHERRVWRDFEVQAFYRPETQGITAELVRDGVIQLSGDRLPLGSQIALRGIFVRIFSNRRPWDILPRDIAENPKLADLEVTQFAVDDGWIGLALGPRRVAARPRRLLR